MATARGRRRGCAPSARCTVGVPETPGTLLGRRRAAPLSDGAGLGTVRRWALQSRATIASVVHGWGAGSIGDPAGRRRVAPLSDGAGLGTVRRWALQSRATIASAVHGWGAGNVGDPAGRRRMAPLSDGVGDMATGRGRRRGEAPSARCTVGVPETPGTLLGVGVWHPLVTLRGWGRCVVGHFNRGCAPSARCTVGVPETSGTLLGVGVWHPLVTLRGRGRRAMASRDEVPAWL
ncbi:hypothetical protein CUTER_09990 [Corynebacterium uterequi]|uniref:Uncharacterized protein n=1 Tax=Corynebacterium uterequi TaxID=1072256 RepID=A0A0G3HF38_9CORY|nr:hypothetical protein CUTER_09990 [Corynebacterium uterequi]